MNSALEGSAAPEDLKASTANAEKEYRIAFAFPGQGAFYPGALRQISCSIPQIGQLLEGINSISLERLGRPFIDTMRDASCTVERLLVQDPAMLQLSIYTLSIAAYALAQTRGVRADVMLGHSLGEIAALACAGVYTAEQGARIVCDRVESMAACAPADGRMAALLAAPETTRHLLASFASHCGDAERAGLVVAVENHEGQTVVSGPADEIDGFVRWCTRRNVMAQRLNSPYAFHHPSLQGASALFARKLSAYPTSRLQVPAYSPILERFYQDNDDFAQLLASHLVHPVRFATAVRFLHAQGAEIYIECGALDALVKVVGRILRPAKIAVFQTLANGANELDEIRKLDAIKKL